MTRVDDIRLEETAALLAAASAIWPAPWGAVWLAGRLAARSRAQPSYRFDTYVRIIEREAGRRGGVVPDLPTPEARSRLEALAATSAFAAQPSRIWHFVSLAAAACGHTARAGGFDACQFFEDAFQQRAAQFALSPPAARSS